MSETGDVSLSASHMTIICAGMMRSASTWSFNACLEILRAAGRRPIGQHSTSFHNSCPNRAGVSADFVFKSHRVDATAIAMLSNGEAKAVCTHRDPLDAIVSGMSFLDLTFEQMLERLDESIRTMDRIRTQGDPVLFLAYEEIMDDVTTQLLKLAEFLKTPLTISEISKVAARTSLQRMKDLSDNFDTLGSQRIVPHPGPWAYDRETLLHPGHVQDAETGKGKERLTAAQKRIVYERVGEPLSELGRALQ